MAEFLSRYFEISVGERKIDRSEGLGEIDHFTFDSAVDYLLMLERVKALENKIESMAANLSDLLILFSDAAKTNAGYIRNGNMSYVA